MHSLIEHPSLKYIMAEIMIVIETFKNTSIQIFKNYISVLKESNPFLYDYY